MPIYELRQNCLTPLNATSFEIERLSERWDIQRLLRDRIECLEDGLMVLAEEFSDWQDSNRRIDLLCLDTEANLVVVELKRTLDGGHMELQAIRYAAMVSGMRFEQAVDAYARFRAQIERAAADHDAARSQILAFLNWAEPIEDDFAQDTRIILASADFSKELTTSVMWLRDREIDIRCVRLKPYRLEDSRMLIDIQQLIPLPEAAEFQTQIGAKRQAVRKERVERHDLRYRFWDGLLSKAKENNPVHANRSPSKDTWISGSIGRTGFSISYTLRQRDNNVHLWIANNKAAYDSLLNQKAEIEEEFGAPLIWKEAEGQMGRTISFPQQGGYRSDPEEWPAIQERMIDAMLRLDSALRARVQAL
ncbi:MAG: DUF4268 domain-containing protein [Aquidulcibacter sp.]|jgi:hypothetical protein|uniref:DUF4268 domain-containing protein n=1 Tax=Aquidulcibacter sp. TaxID=2052990 RepID=UPI0022C8137C|nr:DUF4268 domain-containing protein [Aquidulcibacter sp.]